MYWATALKPQLWTASAKVIVALVVVIGIVLAGSYLRYSGYQDGYKTAQTEGELKLAQFKETIRTLLDAQMKAQREYEAAVESRVATIQKEKEDEVKAINDRYLALANSLRDRPSRNPSTSPSKDPAPSAVDSSGARCTGRELYREDAEFLAREAYRADILRKALKACRDTYEALVRKTEKNQ